MRAPTYAELNQDRTPVTAHNALMPALFVGHGSPMNALEENECVTAWRSVARQLPRPAAILCISAHWETKGTMVTAMSRPRTIHDFYGFPDELYHVAYPAPGAPELAERIRTLAGDGAIGLDRHWGIDHGAWSVLRQMYPAADIPVVQLSLDRRKSPRQQYELAHRLLPLRQDGVLIIGSGNIVHNLRRMQWDDQGPFDWAAQFDALVAELILSGDHDRLINYPALGETARLAIPTSDHWLPLLCTLAVRQDGEAVSFFADRILYGSLAMRSVRIG